MKSIYMLSWIDEIKELGFLGLVESIFRGVIYSFVSMIYSMIRYIYNIFLMLCNGQILDSESINTLFGRVGLLLGVIMLFRVAISFVQAIIDPDNGMDGKKGVPGVIKKVIIVIIMFGISTYTFDLLREVQALIIKNNVISNFILPSQVNTSNFGGALSANLFTAFYNVDPAAAEAMESGDTSKMDDNAQECADKKYIEGLQQHIAEYNDFSYMKDQCLKASVTYADKDSGKETGGFVIEFNFVFSILLGVFVVYYLLSFCVQVGMRIVQLSVLQIISPMAFISYLSPKEDNMFSKWLKVYFSTYIDVFLRMGIISFVCYICAVLMEGWNKPCSSDTNRFCFWNTVGNPSGFTKVVIGAIMIIALFRFAKKAPELLKNIGLGNSASGLGFSPGGFGRFSGALLGGAMGGFMGATASYKAQRELNRDKGYPRALLSSIGGLGSGIASGMINGGKKDGSFRSNLKNAYSARVKSDDEYRNLVARGGSRSGRLISSLSNTFGTDRGNKDLTKINNAKRVSGALSSIFDQAENSSGYKQLMEKKTTALRNNQFDLANDIQSDADRFKDEFVRQSLTGEIQQSDNIFGVGISGGDKVKGNNIRNTYNDLAAEVNQIKPVIVDENGVERTISMEKAEDVVIVADADPTKRRNDLDVLLKKAQRTESNVMGRNGYRAGQANMPGGKNNSGK